MKKNIDLLGNKAKVGDVLLELGRGFGCINGSKYKYTMKLWEVPDNRFDGHAYEYSIDGSKSIFAWAHTEKAVIVDFSEMPKGFEYSFKHGMSDISASIENGTLLELIKGSNWKELQVKKEDVKKFKFIRSLKIDNFEDIIKNIDYLKKAECTPHEIVTKVLQITQVGCVKVNNGETGIAAMFDYSHYLAMLDMISNFKKNAI